MMAGNPSNWWSTILHPPPSHHHHQQEPSSTFLAGSLEHHQHIVGSPPPPPPPAPSSSSLLALNYCNLADINQELPHQSWSQLLLGGMSGDGDIRFNETSHLQSKKLENWLEDHQTLNINPSSTSIQIKQEASQLYGHGDDRERFQAAAASSSKPPYNWPQIMPLNNNASPRSCVTSLSSTNNNNLLDFSYAEADTKVIHQTHHSSECNSTGSGGVTKRARVQSSSTQPPLKVRKEKLGDRITALHQLVSPFGKTDTASVLLEAIGYIRFLQGQIEALSSPYLDNSSANIRNQQQNDMNENAEDLRSRGLCLVPISCTQQVGSDNGADYWAAAAALGGGGF